MKGWTIGGLAACTALGGALISGHVDIGVGSGDIAVPVASLVNFGGAAEDGPDCLFEGSVLPGDDQAALRDDLRRARRVAERNRAALEMLRDDRRWAEPELSEGLESAVADTLTMIEDADAEADCLEQAIEEQFE